MRLRHANSSKSLDTITHGEVRLYILWTHNEQSLVKHYPFPLPPVRNIVDDILCLNPNSKGNIFIIYDRMQNIKNSSWHQTGRRHIGSARGGKATHMEDMVLENLKD